MNACPNCKQAHDSTACPAPKEAVEEFDPTAAPVYGIMDPDYARFFSKARCIAWSEGYALTIHGSFTRDLDVIAVPWTDKPCAPIKLLRRLVYSNAMRLSAEEPSVRNHGRLAWTLLFPDPDDPRWIDFSIIPPHVP